jgi:DNA-binding transcriptional ArsR family regulator
MEKQMDNVIADLTKRISRLEVAVTKTEKASRAPSFPFDVDDPDANIVTYSGHGIQDGSPIAWQMGRTWEDVLEAADDALASILQALASGPRLRIVAELARGPVSTSKLAERLEQSSTGQLFHHLKELLAAGIVHQPQRGVYALRHAHVLPVLAVLSAGHDLTTQSNTDREPA